MGTFAGGHKTFLFTPDADLDGEAARHLVGQQVILMDAEQFEVWEILRSGYEAKLRAALKQ